MAALWRRVANGDDDARVCPLNTCRPCQYRSGVAGLFEGLRLRMHPPGHWLPALYAPVVRRRGQVVGTWFGKTIAA